MSKPVAELIVIELDRLTNQIEQHEESRRKLLQQYADATCPYKVGDIIEVKGWTYAGRQMRVDKVRGIRAWGGKYDWRVVGTIIKKDGTPGKQTADWTGDREEGW